jgi:hypothetical protein
MSLPKSHKVTMHFWENGELKVTHFFLSSLEKALEFGRNLHNQQGKHIKVYDAEGQLADSIGPVPQDSYA